VPLGDFFGTAPGLSRYHSLPLRVFGEGKSFAESAVVMPFARQARISVVNLNNTAFGRSCHPIGRTLRMVRRSLLFHAKWRIERYLPSRRTATGLTWSAKATGRFVGGSPERGQSGPRLVGRRR